MGSPNKKKDKNANEKLHLPEKSICILNGLLTSNRVTDDNKGSSSSSSRVDGDLSTDAILKMAREMLLQGNTQNLDVASILVSCLSHQKSDDLQLALLFQAAVLKFSDSQMDRAKWLLNLCQSSASPSGNALHRIISYFSEALQERICKELGGNEFVPTKLTLNAWKYLDPGMIRSSQLLPFFQVVDLTATQAIVDSVAPERRIHLVDLGIKAGSQWPVLMQALAARNGCAIELLKLSAVGKLEGNETGKMLSSFAESLNIPFEFRLIVSELKDVREDMFELSEGEAVVVYSDIQLARLLPWPDKLVSLLRTVEKLNPCLMVLLEIEASTDSPVVLDRFDACLAVSAAVFDCLDDCMERDDPCRSYVEGRLIWEGIRNAITSEGAERICRSERLDFWRGFMSRFDFVELMLSDIAFCHLDLVVKSNPCWNSCTVEANGKGIVFGWKGSPIKSLSVWKFQDD